MGDVIQVVETMEGWYKGILIETKEIGLFPASFFRVKPSEDGKDPIMRELHSVFREWGDLLKKLYLVCCPVSAPNPTQQRRCTSDTPISGPEDEGLQHTL